MEGLGITYFRNVYRGRRVLVTGHTGFKGSWLALWLAELGAHVTGVSLPPSTSPNHWDLLHLDITEQRIDIRDARAIATVIRHAQPEVVFHLAAQSLVRRSYLDPVGTWSTNVMGTANVLEACREMAGVRAIVVVTTDKCYENREDKRPYRETDRLGGHDPYSASKAGSEMVAASYRVSFFDRATSPLLATARAGNVIGGGDWSEDRLIPDLIRAVASGHQLDIRSPGATRPWQHVLESLSGYLLLGQKLLEEDRDYEGAWNFGPAPDDNCTVAEVLEGVRHFWPQVTWKVDQHSQPREAHLLCLDSTKARERLAWRPVWRLDAAIEQTAKWYRRFLETRDVETRDQLQRYLADARHSGSAWILG